MQITGHSRPVGVAPSRARTTMSKDDASPAVLAPPCALNVAPTATNAYARPAPSHRCKKKRSAPWATAYDAPPALQHERRTRRRRSASASVLYDQGKEHRASLLRPLHPFHGDSRSAERSLGSPKRAVLWGGITRWGQKHKPCF